MLDIKLSFIKYASVHFISALHGSGVGKLFGHITERGKLEVPEVDQISERVANLVDFDVYFGHRNDPAGFAKKLEEFDEFLNSHVQNVGDWLALVPYF